MASERTLGCMRSLQMQNMGIFVDLIASIRAYPPPLSPVDIPSTSSIRIKYFLLAFASILPVFLFWFDPFYLLWFRTSWRIEFVLSSPRIELTLFLLLSSEAFHSLTSYPICFAMSRTAVVLPTPGGPLNKQALEFMFCEVLKPAPPIRL